MKICTNCNVKKELNLFYSAPNSRSKDGLFSYCKECMKQNRKESYLKNKEHTLIINRKWRANNKEKIQKYCEDNKDKVKERNQNNRKQRWFDKYLKNKIEIDKYFNNIKITKDNVEQYVRKYNTHKTNLKRKEVTKVWFNKNEEYLKIYYNENKEKMIKQMVTNNKKRLKTDAIFKFKCNVRCLIKGSFKRGTNQFLKTAKTETILGCTIEEFRLHIQKQFKDGMTLENHGINGWHLDHIIPLASATTEEEIIKLNYYTNFQPLWAKDNLSKGSKNI
jgi:hypothetical protein